MVAQITINPSTDLVFAKCLDQRFEVSWFADDFQRSQVKLC